MRNAERDKRVLRQPEDNFPPFTDEVLDAAARTSSSLGIAGQQSWGPPISDDPICERHLSEWTNPMRLGSTPADTYLEFVRQDFKSYSTT